MRTFISLSLLLGLLLSAGCRHGPPGKGKDFDTLKALVQGKTAMEVQALLGPPDVRRPMLSLGERWVWWRYTYLKGPTHDPDEQGKIVNFEVIFDPVDSALLVTDPLSVDFSSPLESNSQVAQEKSHVREG